VTAALLAAATMFTVVGTAISIFAYLPALAVAETVPPLRPATRARVWLVALMAPVVCAAGAALWATCASLADPYGDPHVTFGHPHLCSRMLLSLPDAPWLAHLAALGALGLVVAAVARAIISSARSARVASRFRGPSRAAGPTVVVNDQAPLVVTLGILRPLTVISSGTIRLLTPAQLRAVLRHEAAHVARRDNLWEVLAAAAATCLAPAPSAHLFLRYWHEDVEQVCDDLAAAGEGPEQVSQALRALAATVSAQGAVTPAEAATRHHLAWADRRARRLGELARADTRGNTRVRPLEAAIAAVATAVLLALVAVATAGQVGDSLRCLASVLLKTLGQAQA
jgi:beta-lactamase regulating signal transducer with metallopeptidase domain